MVLSLEIVSFIVALGGLSVLLVQSYRGESLDRAVEAQLLPIHGDRHLLALIAAVLSKGYSAHQ